jgi:hypothetical protein
VTMEDIEMMAASEEDGNGHSPLQPINTRSLWSFNMKKHTKLRLKAHLSEEFKPVKHCIPNQWNQRVIMQWRNVYMCMLPLTRIQSTQ